jgi:predicted flap endonuclease-1-like 5' DNA nuclease
MDNLIQLAMQIIFCLLIAAILGAIIGYLLGKMSKCDKNEYNNDDDFHGHKREQNKLTKLNDYSEEGSVHHQENIVSSGLSHAQTAAATGVAGVTAAGAGLLGGAKDIGSTVTNTIGDTASNITQTGSNMFDNTKEAASNFGHNTTEAASNFGHNTKEAATNFGHNTTEAASNLGHNITDSGEKYTQDVVRDDITLNNTSIGQEIGIRPQSIQAPMGEADDLKEISGVGLKIEEVLNTLGIYHFEQISEWHPENIEWIENYLSVKRRVVKEDWIGQAKLLAAGGQTEFSKKVRRGDNRNY